MTDASEPPDVEPAGGTEVDGRRAVQGGMWLGLRQVMLNVARLATIGILARQLGPADFGVVALATTLLRFILLFSEGGTTSYILYYREQDWLEEAKAVFWFNEATTFAQCALVGAALLIIPAIYDQQSLVPVLGALLAVFFVRQAGIVPEAIARREFRYKLLSVRDTVINFATAGLSVVMALTGWGVWSLVLPNLVFEPVRLAWIYFAVRFRPGWRWGFDRWRRVFRYTKHLIGSEVLQLALNDGDTLLVGTTLGTVELGFYNLAWQLSVLVGRNIVTVVTDISGPSLANVSGEAGRGPAYRHMVHLLAVTTLPLQSLQFFLASAIVNLLYGTGYAEVIPVLRILLLFMAVRAITSVCGVLFAMEGRPDVGLRLSLFTLPFYVASIFIGSRWGLVGVATGVTVVRITGGTVGLILSLRLLKGPIRSVFVQMIPALASSIGAGLISFITYSVSRDAHLGQLPALVLACAVGGLAYLPLIRLTDRTGWHMLLDVGNHVLPARLRKLRVRH